MSEETPRPSDGDDAERTPARVELLHLSGPFRGRTTVHPEPVLILGTGTDAAPRFPAGPIVRPRHARITFSEADCAHVLRAEEGRTFVNREEVREVMLEHDDLLEIGLDGPRLRFRIAPTTGRTCKPLRRMLADAREVGQAGGRVACCRSFAADLARRATRSMRAFQALLLLGLVTAVAYLAGFSGAHEALRSDAAGSDETLARDLAVMRGEIEDFRDLQAEHVSRVEIERLRRDLAARNATVDDLARRDATLRTVLETYARSVCLIHGVFTLSVIRDDELVPFVGMDGKPVRLESIGSGFLATEGGHVITNRHVAHPWWGNESLAPLLARGLVPSFVLIEAHFPGKAPIPVDPATIRISPDEVDLGLLRIPISGVPVPSLYEGDLAAMRGERIVLLGYPTGVNALLARAESDLAAEAMSEASDLTTLLAALGARGAISPIITQGNLNETREHRLVCDAATTSGGSGGPVFSAGGQVIGVNFAVTRNFDGSNFGVPVSHVRALLEATRAASVAR